AKPSTLMRCAATIPRYPADSSPPASRGPRRGPRRVARPQETPRTARSLASPLGWRASAWTACARCCAGSPIRAVARTPGARADVLDGPAGARHGEQARIAGPVEGEIERASIDEDAVDLAGDEADAVVDTKDLSYRVGAGDAVHRMSPRWSGIVARAAASG